MKLPDACRLVVLWAMIAGPALAAADSVAVPERCAAPEELVSVADELPHVTAALHPGGVLDVLVVGSASTFGHSMLAPKVPGVVTFPWRMAAALEAAVPDLKVKLTIRGGPGTTAGEMADVIRNQLAAQPYQLVLWQTGSVEAVKNLPPGDFTQALVNGADAAAEHGADMMLVDPQFSRFLQAHANVEPYEQALEQVAAMPGVVLLRRFELMRFWADGGQLDLERVPESERGPTLDLLHTCLGAYLARMALAGARS
jgi:acyl-CoA thioesterase I